MFTINTRRGFLISIFLGAIELMSRLWNFPRKLSSPFFSDDQDKSLRHILGWFKRNEVDTIEEQLPTYLFEDTSNTGSFPALNPFDDTSPGSVQIGAANQVSPNVVTGGYSNLVSNTGDATLTDCALSSSISSTVVNLEEATTVSVIASQDVDLDVPGTTVGAISCLVAATNQARHFDQNSAQISATLGTGNGVILDQSNSIQQGAGFGTDCFVQRTVANRHVRTTNASEQKISFATPLGARVVVKVKALGVLVDTADRGDVAHFEFTSIYGRDEATNAGTIIHQYGSGPAYHDFEYRDTAMTNVNVTSAQSGADDRFIAVGITGDTGLTIDWIISVEMLQWLPIQSGDTVPNYNSV